jgi:hypothetical protein
MLMAAKLLSWEGRRAGPPPQPPLPTALPPLPLHARLPLPDAALPLSADDVDIADDMYCDCCCCTTEAGPPPPPAPPQLRAEPPPPPPSEEVPVVAQVKSPMVEGGPPPASEPLWLQQGWLW